MKRFIVSFADAKAGEYIVEDILGVDMPGHFIDLIRGQAEFEGNHFSGQTPVATDGEKVPSRPVEFGFVAMGRDHQRVGQVGQSGFGRDHGRQVGQSLAGQGGDGADGGAVGQLPAFSAEGGGAVWYQVYFIKNKSIKIKN